MKKFTKDDIDSGTTVLDGFTVTIKQDEFDCDPRKEWDHIGTMACWHRRYTLGDEQPKEDPLDYMRRLIGDLDLRDDTNWLAFMLPEFDDDCEDGRSPDEIIAEFSRHFVWLPLYLYDHSGISMSCSNSSYPFNDYWDAGQVGIIYAHKSKQSELGAGLTLEQALRSEVEVYDQYLTGDVWYFSIEDEHGDTLDSCGGIFGLEDVKEEAVQALNFAIQSRHRAHLEQVKTWIKHHVPLQYRTFS